MPCQQSIFNLHIRPTLHHNIVLTCIIPWWSLTLFPGHGVPFCINPHFELFILLLCEHNSEHQMQPLIELEPNRKKKWKIIDSSEVKEKTYNNSLGVSNIILKWELKFRFSNPHWFLMQTFVRWITNKKLQFW